ncbi:MAG: phosphoserine phosphatase SerB, partial [Caulobacteraceae bacterium]|nr:phosphoserine phosphatase SerB [Caulobacteraceae bacterium]
MTIALTLVSPDPAAAEEAARLVEGLMPIATRTLLGPGAIDLSLAKGDVGTLRQQMDHHLANLPVDVCVQPQEGRSKR